MKVYNPLGYNYVTVAKVPKKDVRKIDFNICKQPTETLDSFYSRQIVKPDILINAGFFSMANGNTVFSVICDNTTYSLNQKVKEGIGIIGDREVYYSTVDNKERKWKSFMSAYPPLIVAGKEYQTTLGSEIDYKARRTVFGFDKENYYFICVDNPGMNFKQLRYFCLSVLGCTYAMNFDGGGSTRMLVNGVRKTNLLSNRPVDTVMAVYINNSSKKNIEEGTKTETTVISNTKTKITKYLVDANNTKGVNIYQNANKNSKVVQQIHIGVYTIVEESLDGLYGKLKSGIGWIYLPDVRKISKGV